MADSAERASDDARHETLAERARRMADRITRIIDDVVSSFATDDPDERARQLQRVNNEILIDILPVVGWLERRQPQAAYLLKCRLHSILKHAESCVAHAIPEWEGGKIPDRPRDTMSEGAELAAVMQVSAILTADSIRAHADEIEADEKQRQRQKSGDGSKPRISSWQDVAKRLERLKQAGEPFISQRHFADRLGCATSTVNKAIKKTPTLRPWASSGTASKPKAQSLNEAVLGKTAQERESNPADTLEESDVDVAMRYLIEHAKPEERAKINAMTPDRRRELARLAYSDPAKGDRILGRKA